MAAPQNIVAVVFDFDDTLTDDTISQLLSYHGVDPKEFWQEHQARVKRGWEPSLSYLNLLLDKIEEGKLLGKLTKADLARFGEKLKFYPGIPGVFAELKKLTADFKRCIPAVEFYIISGGLADIIRGCSIKDEFTGIYASEFDTDDEGVLRTVKTAVSFSEKLRYLFEICKGIPHEESNKNPYLVNEHRPQEERRIPFFNMMLILWVEVIYFRFLTMDISKATFSSSGMEENEGYPI